MIEVLQKQPFAFENQGGFKPNSVDWFSLFRIDQDRISEATRELIQRYSRYKYGSFVDIHQLAFQLGGLVNEACGRQIWQDRENWVVFTPPYSSVEPAVKPIGDSIAKMFGIPHIDLRTIQVGDKKRQYAAIVDSDMRLQAKLSVETFIDGSIPVEGKKALVIDDMLATGTTAGYMNKILYDRHHLDYVKGFCLLDLVADTPAFEEYINRFLITSGDLETLVLILNDPRTVINRHTLKSLYGEDKNVLDLISPSLLISAISKLEEARIKYYSGAYN